MNERMILLLYDQQLAQRKEDNEKQKHNAEWYGVCECITIVMQRRLSNNWEIFAHHVFTAEIRNK